MIMQLYHFPWGIYPRRVLIYLKEKGVEAIELTEIDMVAGENHASWFLAVNPAGTVPVLRTESGALVRETAAILEYLEEVVPGPDLIGTTPERRARTRDLAGLVHVAYAFGNTYVAQVSPLLEHRVTRSPGAVAAMLEEHERQLTTLDAQVGDGAFMGGDAPSIADISFFASAQYFDLFYQFSLPERFTKLRVIYERFSSRPSAAPPIYPEALARIAGIVQLGS